MHLYYNSSSALATIFSLNMKEFFPACFFCKKNLNRSRISLESDGYNIVFETRQAIIAGDLGIDISDMSPGPFLPFCLINFFIFFPALKIYLDLVDQNE